MSMYKYAFACTLALAACGDDESDIAPIVTPDAAAPPVSEPATPDAGTPVDERIPLVLWVDDLLDHHTNDESPPDTVDDKKIVDDEDSSHFTRRF